MPGMRKSTVVAARIAALCGAAMLLCSSFVWAEPTAQQTYYWWQDEIRSTAFELSIARTGAVAQWGRMTVPAGSAVMPVPPATGPIEADGKLDEPAWQDATLFPVGPIFDDWQRGPLMLNVRACRDEKNIYVAIESPRDLTGLGSLSPGGQLFTVGKRAVRIKGRVVELVVPIEGLDKGEVSMVFPVETLHRVDGKLAPEDMEDFIR